jgi:chorismate mutase
MNFKNLFKKGHPYRKFALIALSLGVIPFFAAFSGGEVREIKSEVTVQEQTDAAKIDALLTNLNDRLILMHDISRWKWDHTVAIDEPEHEYKALTTLSQKCKDRHIDPVSAEEIIHAQIQAGKIVQIKNFEKWVSQNEPIVSGNSDYDTELQNKLDILDSDLVDQLEAVIPILKKRDLSSVIQYRAKTILNQKDLTLSARETALTPILSLYNKVSST